MTELKTVRLAKPRRIADWLALYRLYRTAFPRAERKPAWVILQQYQKGKMDIWCLQQSHGFRGLAITINGDRQILLDYLAVEKRWRGCGIGTGALAALRQHYEGKDVFLEIESVFEDVPDLSMRQRRKAFYLRSGLKPMEVMVYLFGVKMELLGYGDPISYAQYHRFYTENLGSWVASHIQPAEYPK